VKLGHALLHWTREDEFNAEAAKVKDPKARRALLAQGRECSMLALRYYRTLKWASPDGPKRIRAPAGRQVVGDARGRGVSSVYNIHRTATYRCRGKNR
jgi:hypothetical protein